MQWEDWLRRKLNIRCGADRIKMWDLSYTENACLHFPLLQFLFLHFSLHIRLLTYAVFAFDFFIWHEPSCAAQQVLLASKCELSQEKLIFSTYRNAAKCQWKLRLKLSTETKISANCRWNCFISVLFQHLKHPKQNAEQFQWRRGLSARLVCS